MSLLPLPRLACIAPCATLLLALAACTPPPPPIVLRPPAPARHLAAPHTRAPAQSLRCEQPARRPPLTEAEKTRLFNDFDGWKGEHRPPGSAADSPTPPPAPGQNRATPPGCRVPRT